MSPEQRVHLQNEIANSSYEIPEDRAAKLLEQGNTADADLSDNAALVAGLHNPNIGETTSVDSPVAHEAIDQGKTAAFLGNVAVHEDWDEDRIKAVQAQNNLK